MRVLLIAPHFAGHREQVAFVEPGGICLLAAVLERQGIQTRVLHQVTPEHLSHDAAAREAAAFAPDCIGVSTMSENHLVGLDLARRLKARLDAPIVFGGVHATFNPEIALDPAIDVAALGHALDSFPQILARVRDARPDWTGVDGVAFRRDGELRVQAPRPFAVELDALPMPKRDDLPIERYRVWPMLLLPPSRQRVLSVYTRWGCKYNCAFCLVPTIFGRRLFAQSPARVLAELEHLRERYGINFVHFHDDDFCHDRERAEQICRGLIDRRLGLKFGMMTRFDHLDRELLDLLERAGLIMLTLGIEAGTEDGLQQINKGLTLGRIRERLALTRGRRIQINGTYMTGFPWESAETINEAFRFVLTLPLDTWSLNVLIPFKGLRIRETLEREGLIAADDLNRFSYKEVVVRTRFLTQAQLERLASSLLVRYYFRPAYVWRLARRMARYPEMRRAAWEILLWGLGKRWRLLTRSFGWGRAAARGS